MKKIALTLGLIAAALLGFSQEYAIQANIKSAKGLQGGAGIAVFQDSKQVATINTDTSGQAFIRFKGAFPQGTRSLVIRQPGYKRYVLDVKSIKKDVRFDLEMKVLSSEEKSMMDRVERDLDKIDDKFGTLFFLLEETGNLKSITYTEFSGKRSMSKIIGPLMKPDEKAAAERRAKEDEIKKAAYEQQQATQEAEATANKAEFEAGEAQEARDKSDKKLKKFQKKQSKLGDEREKIRREQRKLDKKRNKISPDKAESWQESITRSQRKLDKQQRKHDNALKDHMKDQPK